MRIDKYLKNSRIIKRRTVAKEACEQGMVLINDKKAKPGDEIHIGDIVQVSFGTHCIRVQVLDIDDNVKKSHATDLYKIID